MLRERKTQQQGEYELVMLEELVPQDHFLRKVDAAVDFSFIHDMCKNLYCLDNGRPAIEPELLFNMLLLGYPELCLFFFGNRSVISDGRSCRS